MKALRDRLEMVEDERDALEQRVQNLETIVTSETWDALHDATADPSSLPEATDPVELPSHEDRTDQDASMQEQAEELARRLRA